MSNGFSCLKSKEPLGPFAIFAFLASRPFGGWGDFDGAFHSLEEALHHIRNRHQRYDIWEVVDLRISEVVWKGVSEGVGPLRQRRELRQSYPNEVLEAVDC